jgi:uncharacterized protein
MSIHPRRLHERGRELTGILQTPGDKNRKHGVLMCRPVGQEAVRTNAMFRAICERLVREGLSVLRFDYYGTGDSPGEEKAQDVDGLVADICSAHESLVKDGFDSISWFGMRLGANAAAQAAQIVKRAPARIVLWEPVLSGTGYLKSLLDGHREELCREFGGVTWHQLVADGKAAEPALPGDVLGFQYGAALIAQLQGGQQLSLNAALRRGIKLVCVVRQEDAAALAQLPESPLLRKQTVQTVTNWLSSQAMGSAVAPPDAIGTLIETLQT